MKTSESNAQKIRQVCEFIRANSTEQIDLTSLAKRAGLSPFHFQRSFKATTGVSPKQYLEACRLDALKGRLRQGPSVTDAIYEAGYGSSSRVYERVDTRLGMTPSEYRAGGKGIVISYASVDCALGRMMMGATDRGLCFVQFADSDEELLSMLRAEYPKAVIEPMKSPASTQFEAWMRALRAHVEGQEPKLDLPLDVRATAFQMRVWKYLQAIPAGSVQSYSEVAEGIGQPTASRAVARACAANPVALVIPCHRVIRGTGEMGGYRWGVERKRVILDRERKSSGTARSEA